MRKEGNVHGLWCSGPERYPSSVLLGYLGREGEGVYDFHEIKSRLRLRYLSY